MNLDITYKEQKLLVESIEARRSNPNSAAMGERRACWWD